MADRLRNAAAKTVKLVHELLTTDLAVKSGGAPAHEVRLYLECMDEVCAALLAECRIWLGGVRYTNPKKCAHPCPNHSLNITSLIIRKLT